MTRLLVVRHAQPDGIAQRCYGSLDVGLASAGRRDAVELGRDVASAGVGAVVSSPSRRAAETAEHIGIVRALDERLREIDFGAFEGRTYDELEREEPELFRRWMTAPTSVTFPGGESFADLRSRVTAVVRDLRSRHPDEVVAVVTHGGVVRAMLVDALGLAPANAFRLDVGYCRVTVIDTIGGAVVVRQVNGTARDLPPGA